MKVNLLLCISLVIALNSCSGVKKNDKVESAKSATTTEVSTKTENYYGTYEGVLPCADCEGIKTTLKINPDKTYNLESVYLNKKDGDFDECGTYDVLNGNVIELITPSSNYKTYYRILDNSVMLSDKEGTINNGPLAEHYILKKK